MAEREQRLLAVRVVPAVADQDTLVVAGVAVGAGPALGAGDRAPLQGGGEGERQAAAGVGVPNRTAASAWPNCWPGSQACSTAPTRPSQGIRTGPPVLSTTTVRGLASATAAISRSWSPGRARDARSMPSPTAVLATTTATSDSAASRAASWIRSSGGCQPSRMLPPPRPESMTGQAVALE